MEGKRANQGPMMGTIYLMEEDLVISSIIFLSLFALALSMGLPV